MELRVSVLASLIRSTWLNGLFIMKSSSSFSASLLSCNVVKRFLDTPKDFYFANFFIPSGISGWWNQHTQALCADNTPNANASDAIAANATLNFFNALVIIISPLLNNFTENMNILQSQS